MKRDGQPRLNLGWIFSDSGLGLGRVFGYAVIVLLACMAAYEVRRHNRCH